MNFFWNEILLTFSRIFNWLNVSLYAVRFKGLPVVCVKVTDYGKPELQMVFREKDDSRHLNRRLWVPNQSSIGLKMTYTLTLSVTNHLLLVHFGGASHVRLFTLSTQIELRKHMRTAATTTSTTTLSTDKWEVQLPKRGTFEITGPEFGDGRAFEGIENLTSLRKSPGQKKMDGQLDLVARLYGNTEREREGDLLWARCQGSIHCKMSLPSECGKHASLDPHQTIESHHLDVGQARLLRVFLLTAHIPQIDLCPIYIHT